MRSLQPIKRCLLVMSWIGLSSYSLSGCTSEDPGSRRPNVLLITVDTLRADEIGVQRPGADPGESNTPNIDGLAQKTV